MHGTTSASIVEVIRVIEIVGDGRETPVRQVVSYWTKEGELIAHIDEFKLTDDNTQEKATAEGVGLVVSDKPIRL